MWSCSIPVRVRDLAEQKALGKMGLLGRLRANKPEMVFGFLGCMAQSRGAELVRDIGHVDLVVGTQKFHASRITWTQLVQRKRALRERLMDDARFSIVDVEEEAGSQETIREHVLRGAAGDGVRLDHAGLQHALHVLHRAEHARRGAVAADRGDRCARCASWSRAG